MNRWPDVLDQVHEVVAQLLDEGCPDPYFRGHAKKAWGLDTKLTRFGVDRTTENRLFFQFTALGGHLLPEEATSWDCLFLMQHHGLPTRLLDWTTNFAVALYFAVKSTRSDAAIWILNPYALNEMSVGEAVVEDLNYHFPAGYERYFTDPSNEHYNRFPAPVLAVTGNTRIERMRSQSGAFTLHKELDRPLEKICPDVVWKIVIPRVALREARGFLQLAGVNEYSVFPDFDGLARHILDVEI